MPEVFGDIYINMEIALPHDGEVPEFSKLLSDCVIEMTPRLALPMEIQSSILEYTI